MDGVSVYGGAVRCRSALAAAVGATAQPTFPAKSDPAKSTRDGVVKEAHPPVVEEQLEGRPALQHVLNRLGEVMSAREFGDLFAPIDFERVGVQ